MYAELVALLGTIAKPISSGWWGGSYPTRNSCASFRRAPAAKGLHHAYVAGLLEHTLGVAKLADRVAPLYPVHRDLLLAGAFLHDVGKVEELSAGAGFDYTDAGRFVATSYWARGWCARAPKPSKGSPSRSCSISNIW